MLEINFHIHVNNNNNNNDNSLGECCVALGSLIGTSLKFETFLSHRGEEMGSIRGRVRVHVPKDRWATRKKIYGGSSKNILPFITALLALSLPSKSPLSLHSPDSAATLALLPLYGSSMTPWLGLTHLLVSIDRFLFLAPDWLTLARCILRH